MLFLICLYTARKSVRLSICVVVTQRNCCVSVAYTSNYWHWQYGWLYIQCLWLATAYTVTPCLGHMSVCAPVNNSPIRNPLIPDKISQCWPWCNDKQSMLAVVYIWWLTMKRQWEPCSLIEPCAIRSFIIIWQELEPSLFSFVPLYIEFVKGLVYLLVVYLCNSSIRFVKALTFF